MRKKIFLGGIILALAIMPVPTFAKMADNDYSYMSEYEDESAETELSYIQNSSYIVKIPLRINNVVEGGYTFTAESINILDNESVNIYTENSMVKMTNERGDTCNLELSCSDDKGKENLVGTFKNGETTSSVTMNAQMGSDARAGSYTGTATFSVRLE